jgi:adenine-specific DNA-methyltransferase
MAKRKQSTSKGIETITHKDAARRNIPTAEYESMMDEEQKSPVELAYERRNRDLDPQLVWRGKDEQDETDLFVKAPPLYIQEKIHPKVLIDDLKKRSAKAKANDGQQDEDEQADLFGDFNGVADEDAKTEFYKHDANWTNRMILGDSLRVMGSLAEREGLRGKVQCIYFDPPYGIKFNSNFQWSTTTRDVKDGNVAHITREPEQVKAFRDTWRDGIHSYLTYLRDRLTVARDLLTESGSIFVQIGDENVHRVRALMDEVFGDDNFVSEITVSKTSSATTELLAGVADYVIWFSKNKDAIKYRQLFIKKELGGQGSVAYTRAELPDGSRVPLSEATLKDGSLAKSTKVFTSDNLTSQRPPGSFPVQFEGETYTPRSNYWKTGEVGFPRLIKANRVIKGGKVLRYVRYFNDFLVFSRTNIWADLGGAPDKSYVVESNPTLVQRCILMTTDPGDLVLDPTCGSGTTAHVAEQWGRRWITIDTSRVSLALARARIMGAKYDYYLLADSPEGQKKEAELQRKAPAMHPTYGDIRQGFVYERVPHIMLKDIANNAEIDEIWEQFQENMELVREALNKALGKTWEAWEIPREAGEPWPEKAAALHHDIQKELDKGVQADQKYIKRQLKKLNEALESSYELDSLPETPVTPWADEPSRLHAKWWKLRIARQKEMDASIAANAEQEYLYDRPYADKNKVRVAGPFTVESLSPHRVAALDENDEIIEEQMVDSGNNYGKPRDFGQLILDNLREAGIQQAHKEDRISFESLEAWPGEYIAAEGYYQEGEQRRRAGILIGPEFGTVSRPDLVAAAREAADAGFDVVVACAFSYEAHAAEFNKLGRIPVLKANMNADLHMADDLSGKGNLFVIFGEPDIDVIETDDNQLKVRVNGVDVFHPQTGEIRSDNAEGIACWFLDTDYNEESFFVRHAYFLGAGDPYKSLKTTLKSEINKEAWQSLNSDTSTPFEKPGSGRIAVKVINHLGDEVMKVFRV